jgi:hypothetical protein
MFGSSYLNHLDMNTRFKVFASYNILQCLCDFIHVLIFVTVSKCRKNPKLTNIVITSALHPHVLSLSLSLHMHLTSIQAF